MFDVRSYEPEIMDDLAFSDPVIFQTLREIDTINFYLGGNKVTMEAVKKVLSEMGAGSSIVLGDLGCGSGDIIKRLAAWSVSRGLKIHFRGIDANPHIITYAEKHCERFSNISFQCINIFEDEFDEERYDIATCTLFCHHFNHQEMVDILSRLKSQVRKAIIINDIHRHWLAYYSIKLITGIFSKSYMVKYDAKLSVLRAFKKKELKAIIEEAGFTKYSIKWRWAFRYQVILWCE